MVLKTVLGSHFGGFVYSPPILVYSGDWDVHWGYRLLDTWPFVLAQADF